MGNTQAAVQEEVAVLPGLQQEEQHVLNELSAYSLVDSETNVTMKEAFEPCDSMNQWDMSEYTAPKSETNVTMNEAFARCRDVAAAVYSTYTAPPSETNVTLNDWKGFDVSEYTAPPSETNVTMADAFHQDIQQEHLEDDEVTALDYPEIGANYVEHLQEILGIDDSKVVGLKGANGSVSKIIDSNECLLHLEHFEPVPVEF